MKIPKHILKLTEEEKLDFLNSFDYIVSDCDGVVWKFEGPLEGAKEGIQALRSLKKKISFVTNNSFMSKEMFLERIADLEVEFDYDNDILHPAESIAVYLKEINFQGVIYLIASPPFRAVLEGKGFQCISMPDSLEVSTLNEIMEMIFEMASKYTVGAVVYDVDLNFNLTKFYAAQYFLTASPECHLIYGANDKRFRCFDNFYAGVGLFMEALASQCTQKPAVLGKPSADLGHIVMRKFKITDKSRVLFIGDTLKQDIGFANSSGFKSLLVLSGTTTAEMMHGITEEEEIPDYYADNLSDFVTLLNGKQLIGE